jgi:signal transduction histidine kinase
MEAIDKLTREGMPYRNAQEGADASFREVMNALSDQNERLQQFSHIVSHNLRSHSGNLELMLKLLRESQDEGERELFLSQIENISGSLSETIYNLGEVIRIHNRTTGSKSQVSIRKVIQKALDTLGAELESTHGKVQVGLMEWEELHGEPAYFDSIVLNLICNAIKYRDLIRKPEIRIDALLHDGKKRLTISDNGLGIDLTLYGDKLFGMYKTFHKHKDARGIGLFITKSQVEAMGGKIWVESTPGIGSRFILEFTADCSSDPQP